MFSKPFNVFNFLTLEAQLKNIKRSGNEEKHLKLNSSKPGVLARFLHHCRV